MTTSDTLFPPSSCAHRTLHEVAHAARCAVICGVPGMGKSLLLREQALLARAQGRTVHRLQWDVARQPFERPSILARYAEIEGSTHPVIRRAAGLWVRRAVARWFEGHPDAGHLLLIEAPLVGARFIELARLENDAAETLLAGERTSFLVPVPSREVRAAIEAARGTEMAAPRHARDAANAIPVVVDALWQEVVAAARALALPGTESCEYSPGLYAALYGHVLRHRHVREVPVTEVITSAGSPHEHSGPSAELAPRADEVSALIEEAEAAGVEAVVRASEAWYRLGAAC
jgi:hypothetical protein